MSGIHPFPCGFDARGLACCDDKILSSHTIYFYSHWGHDFRPCYRVHDYSYLSTSCVQKTD